MKWSLYQSILVNFKNEYDYRIICGITEDTQRGHIIRASMEAVCFQVRDILEAMHKDCGIPLTKLQVDGGMTCNNLLMQLQADLVGIPVGTCINKLSIHLVKF